jgi:hypothetical protein
MAGTAVLKKETLVFQLHALQNKIPRYEFKKSLICESLLCNSE